MSKISIIVPCFNESESIPYFYKQLQNVMNNMKNSLFEILFIDDGSNDNTLDLIKKLSTKDKRIKYFSFSRNFGKESAMLCGLENCTGDYVAIMDADMQDPPSLLIQMYSYIKNEDYDCIAARRTTRYGEPKVRSFFSKCFYKIINKISKVEIVDGARDFRLMKRKMVTAILSMNEYNRFSKGIFSWVGFNTKWIEYTNIERSYGKTKWSFLKLLSYSLEGIINFSTVPLSLSFFLSSIFITVSIIIMFSNFIKIIFFGTSFSTSESIISIILFVSGIQLFCTGVVSAYLSRTYLESKKGLVIFVVKQMYIQAM